MTRFKFHVLALSILIIASIALYYFHFLFPSSSRRLYNHELHSETPHASPNSAWDVRQALNPNSHRNRPEKLLKFDFNVTRGYRYPDGVKKLVYLINGKFPGPTIEARSGDRLEVHVHNFLDGEPDEELAIHWHGLSMWGSNGMDGVVGLTQKGIKRHQSFKYRFKIRGGQAGSFWYHAHSHVQRADGLYGALIIHESDRDNDTDNQISHYDEDILLLVGDWYHRSARDILKYYTNWRNFGNEPAPDSLLINGFGHFNCSMAVPARPLDCQRSTKPHLKLNRIRTRLRIINTGALTGFNLAFSGYRITLLQVDGGNDVAEGYSGDSIGIIYPGERVDLLLESLKKPSDGPTNMTVSFDPENLRFPNPALTATQSFPIGREQIMDDILGTSIPTSLGKLIDLSHISGPTRKHNTLSATSGAVFLFYTKIEILAEYENVPKGFINRTSWSNQWKNSTPLIELSPSQRRQKAYILNVNGTATPWVDIVVNNLDDKGHPFHLHGTTFLILSSHMSKDGLYEAYNPYDLSTKPAGGPMNVVNPVQKDTVFVPRMGYVVLRFRADNPGLWYFHCHVLWHESVGMAMAFQID